jgi:hypothetical protein
MGLDVAGAVKAAGLNQKLPGQDRDLLESNHDESVDRMDARNAEVQEAKAVPTIPAPRRGAAPKVEPVGEPEPRGMAAKVEPAAGAPEFGNIVILPDRSRIPDETSPTGFVMAPVRNLDAVARGGQRTGNAYRQLMMNPGTSASAALTYLGLAVHRDLAQGGSLDYQRERNASGGFTQLRHFKNVANVNVGLYMQQAGMTLEETLFIAGRYARRNSSNARPSEPYSLHPDQKKFIEIGFEIGRRHYGSAGASR